MTDDAFDALWFLYHVTKRELGGIASKGSKQVSTLTHFHHAIHSALHRANNSDVFIRSLEKTVGLNFDKFDEYSHAFPTPEAFVELFARLKAHSVLYYMPQLIERAKQEKELVEEPTETQTIEEASQ